MSNKANVGFLGLGAMGTGMARNLHKAGLLAAVWNRTTETATALANETGCIAAASVAELALHCDVIIVCVSTDTDVLQMIDEMTTHLKAGTVVVDCSTVAVATAQTAATQLAEHGAGFLDAPVSGGTEGAKNGALVVMAGGEAKHLELAQPALEAMSARVVHIGDVGSGQATKAVNQIMAAGIAQGVTEGMAFAEAMGLPLDKVVDVVGSGAAGSWFVQNRGKTMVRGEYPPGFKVALHHKDLKICQRMAAHAGSKLLSVEQTLVDYEQLMDQGFGDEDISAMYRLKHPKFSA